jgi:hypothetical protein
MSENNLWAERVREQNEDLETDRVREDLQVNLTDKEYSNLKLMAYKAGFESAGKLLSSFVGDLTGWHPNGSDESSLADQWYERAFGIWTNYFRYHLFNNDYSLASMQDMLEFTDYFEEVYEEYSDENRGKDLESKEDCMKLLEEIIKEGKEL